MVRHTKKPEERRAEILEVTRVLFETKGYEATSVDAIVKTVGIAKGTFYYYFKSKEDIVEALVEQMMVVMVESARVIVDDPKMSAIEKLCAIFSAQNQETENERSIVEGYHRPENKAFHDRSNIEYVRVFGPILAEVVEQGKKEGVFSVDNSLSTMQFILAGSQLLLGEGVFNWTPEEKAVHIQALMVLVERAVGAPEDAIASTLGRILQKDDSQNELPDRNT